MRVLVLAPTLPDSLNSASPWHFFQELVPLAQCGVEVVVASRSVPSYSLPGVQFHKLATKSLKRNPAHIVNALRFAVPLLHAIRTESFLSLTRLRKIISCASWNCELAKLIDDLRPDIVHSHWAFPGNSGGAIAASYAGVPLVLTLRGIEHQIVPQHNYGACLDPANQIALRCALRLSQAITVCCTDSVERIEAVEPGSSTKARMVFHAVDENRLNANHAFAKELWQSHGLDGRHVVTYVSRMEDGFRKGHHTLLHAFKQVCSEAQDCTLLLVGDGPDRASFQKMACELGIDGNVLMIGKVHPNDVGGILAKSTISVLPSFSESFANVVFESLLMGTPVVSSAVGTPKDLLGQFGITVPVGDARALAAAIRTVLAEPSKYKELASHGAVFVRRNMSVAQRVSEFKTLYEELVLGAAGHKSKKRR